MDFVIVETTGVRFYKVDNDKHVFKEIKNFTCQIYMCWFEPINEVLVCSIQPDNLRVQSYFFGEKKPNYKYKGPEFELEKQPLQKSKVQTKQFSASQILKSSSHSILSQN